jgi:hypothetical protein
MTKEMSMSDGASQPAASGQYRCWTYHPKTYREPTHKEWLREVDSLKEELANARRTGQYWKDEHLVGNAQIERLRAALTTIAAYRGRVAVAHHLAGIAEGALEYESEPPAQYPDPSPIDVEPA